MLVLTFHKIAESFRKFGIRNNTKDLLVVKVSTSSDITHESVAQHLEKVIEGTSYNFDDKNIRSISNDNDIKKIYKLGSLNIKLPPKTKDINGTDAAYNKEEVEAIKRFEGVIVGSVALRGAV